MWPKKLWLDALQAGNVLLLFSAGCNNNKKGRTKTKPCGFLYRAHLACQLGYNAGSSKQCRNMNQTPFLINVVKQPTCGT